MVARSAPQVALAARSLPLSTRFLFAFALGHIRLARMSYPRMRRHILTRELCGSVVRFCRDILSGFPLRRDLLEHADEDAESRTLNLVLEHVPASNVDLIITHGSSFSPAHVVRFLGEIGIAV